MEYKGRVNVDHILNGEWLEGIMQAEADRVAMKARAAAPVDTGELKASITSRTEKHSGARRDRVVGVVEARVDHSLAAEFGTSTQPGHYFLRRSAG